MITLAARNLAWLGPGKADACAHGVVEFAVDGTTFVGPGDGQCNLTAAGLFLLRTLTDDHASTDGETVATSNFLLPCCANPYVVDAKGPVLVMGCNSGVDVDVVHCGDGQVAIGRGERRCVVAIDAWCAAVLAFVHQIEAFYERSEPKACDDLDEREGWDAVWCEWRQRTFSAASRISALFEPVHTIEDWHDGPRSGLADFQGVPHRYTAQWPAQPDACEDAFLLHPVDDETAVLLREQDAIWRRWEAEHRAGRQPVDTHPALPNERARYEELQRLLAPRLQFDAACAARRCGEFRFHPTRVRWFEPPR